MVKSVLYYLSDDAFATISRMAEQQGFVAQGAIHKRGLSNFINKLSEQEFDDTRPKNVISRHIQEIQTGRAPTWKSYQQRKTRTLQITDKARANFYKIAIQVGIIKANEPWIVGGPDRYNLVSITSYVLEGIGLRWVTPKRLPL
jgi:hypothetical protein